MTPNEALLEIWKTAARIRETDLKVCEAIRRGRLDIIYYSPRGQEIIPAAISTHLTTSDYIVTIYRGLHDQVAKGVPLAALWAEYAGRVTGTCKGKGGPMHITHPESGVMVTTGVVGSGMPIAVGLGLGAQLEGAGKVAVSYFGDGASNIGAFHESLNLASVWKLPVIFVCQNNRYAEHTRFDVGTSVETVAERAASYGMPGVSVDGNDADAMWAAAEQAVARARAGEGPTLIEANTFRFMGHLVGDPGHYIPKEEMAEAMAADPVPMLRASLIARGIATEESLGEAEAAIADEVARARDQALDAPWPDLIELQRDIVRETA